MIRGFFEYSFPMVELLLNGNNIKFLLETGFNGHIMLPKKIIDKIELELIGSSDYTTASGEGRETEVYKAMLNFGSIPNRIS